jgi:hypothetical protein
LADGSLTATKIAGGTVSDAEFDYLNGVTSAVQTQLDAKATLTATQTALDLKANLASPTFTGTLEVTGAATNTVAINFGNNTSINFALSNIAYTNTTSATITLNGLKNGGAYTLACTATMVSNEVTFTAAGFTFRAMGTAARTNGKVHLYSFIVAGTQVYVSMATEN